MVLNAPASAPEVAQVLMKLQPLLSPNSSAARNDGGATVAGGSASVLSTVSGAFVSNAANASGVQSAAVSVLVAPRPAVVIRTAETGVLPTPSPTTGWTSGGVTESSANNRAPGIIIGILLAVVCLLLLLLLLAWALWRYCPSCSSTLCPKSDSKLASHPPSIADDLVNTQTTLVFENPLNAQQPKQQQQSTLLHTQQQQQQIQQQQLEQQLSTPSDLPAGDDTWQHPATSGFDLRLGPRSPGSTAAVSHSSEGPRSADNRRCWPCRISGKGPLPAETVAHSTWSSRHTSGSNLEVPCATMSAEEFGLPRDPLPPSTSLSRRPASHRTVAPGPAAGGASSAASGAATTSETEDADVGISHFDHAFNDERYDPGVFVDERW
jgi:hypothetical protein